MPRSRLQVVTTALSYTELPDARACAAVRARLAGDDSPVLAALGALEPVKDHASLLEAAALLQGRWPRLRVLIAGEGSLREPLLALARETA